MINIFDYKTFHSHLLPATRSLAISLSNPRFGNKINETMLNELHDIFNWCAEHSEVNSIIFSASSPFLSLGWDDDFSEKSPQEIDHLYKLLHTVISQLINLPQTTIVDFKEQTRGIAFELFLACDIRVCHQSLKFKFDYLDRGLIPGATGVSLLNQITSVGFTQRCWLTSATIQAEELKTQGVIHEIYEGNRSDIIDALMETIAKQSAVSRLQTKGIINQQLNHFVINQFPHILKASRGALQSEDYKLYNPEEATLPTYMKLRDYKEKFKTVAEPQSTEAQ